MSFFNTPRITTNSEGDRFPPGYWTLEKAIAQFKVFRDENDLREKSVSILLKTVNPRLSAALNMFGGFKKLNEEFKLGLKLGRAKCSTTQIKSSKHTLEKPG